MKNKKLTLAMLSTAFVWSVGHAEVSVTLAHGSPAKHVITKEFVEPWKECVEQSKGSAISFKYFPSGQLAKIRELLPAMETGVADVTPVPIGYSSDKLPLNGVAMLPGLGGSSEDIVSAYWKTLSNNFLADEFAANKIVPISVMAFPPYQIVSASKEIKTPEDFKGKVIRSAGGAMDLIIKSLGGSPATISISDTYVALQRGTADATISALASVDGYKLQELSKAISTNGSFGTFVNVLSVRKDKWEQLSTGQKRVFLDCGAKIQLQSARNLDASGAGLAEKFEKAGVQMFQFSPQQLSQLSTQLGVVHEDWVGRMNSRGLQADAVLKAYKANF